MKILTALSAAMLFLHSAQAASKTNLYFGLNVGTHVLNVQHALVFDPRKVDNTVFLNWNAHDSSHRPNPEFIVGLSHSMHKIFVGAEAFVNPVKHHHDAYFNSILSRFEQQNRFGGRVKAGVSSAKWTVYAIAGLGQARIKNEVLFTGIYHTLPLLIEPIHMTETISYHQLGGGISYAFNKHFAMQLEYLDNHYNPLFKSAVNHQRITFFNPLGHWQNATSSYQAQVGVKYFIT